jgi:hypothetical protein
MSAIKLKAVSESSLIKKMILSKYIIKLKTILINIGVFPWHFIKIKYSIKYEV